MPLLSPSAGERLAGMQVGRGSLSRPGIAFIHDEDTGINWRNDGEFDFVSNGVRVGGVTADGIALPLFSQGSVLFAGAGGTVTEDPDFTFTAASNRLSVGGDIVTPSIGPAAAQQHTLPAVVSDTVALLAATQAFTNKTLNLASNTLVATSAQLLTAVTDETGTGVLVFGTNPTIAGPTLSGTVIGTYSIGGTPTLISAIAMSGAPDFGTGLARAGTLFATALNTSGDATIGDQVIVSGAGPHAIGGAVNALAQVLVTGTYTSDQATARILSFGTTIAAGADSGTLAGIMANMTINERGAGTHPVIAGIYADHDTGAGGAATTINTKIYASDRAVPAGTSIGAGLYLAGAPTGATNNYALYVAAGDTRLPLGGGTGIVSVDAVDTAGVGFRGLRVPN